jgi:hypothetical protein
MKNKDEVEKSIKNNDLDLFKVFFYDQNCVLYDLNYMCISLAVQYNRVEFVELILTDKRVDFNLQANLALVSAAQLDYINIVEIILNNDNFIPLDIYGQATNISFNFDHHDLTKMLWSDHRGKKLIQKNYPELNADITKKYINKKISDF